MDHLIIPKDYKPDLNLHDTQVAIKTVKDCFQELLAERLNLTRVSAPLFLENSSGLNDNLNGVEKPVKEDDHCMDALRYYIMGIWKYIKRYLPDVEKNEGGEDD